MSTSNYSIDGLINLLDDLQNLSVFLSTDTSSYDSTAISSLRCNQLRLSEMAYSYALLLKEFPLELLSKELSTNGSADDV